jgi:hypothetical protein
MRRCFVANSNSCGYGDGSGDGYGYGYGYGDGYGNGYGNGTGYGYGYGYGDGYGNGNGYGILHNNVRFPFASAYFAFVKKSLSGKDILGCKNTEQKAYLIMEYGYEFILKDANALLLDTQKVKSKVDGKTCTYQLFEYELAKNLKHKIISVECHSTHKKTFLGARQEAKTCIEAIGNTFPNVKYEPEIET